MRRLHRRSPHGLLSIRYFLPFQSNIVKNHRRLWFAGRSNEIAILLWISLEMWLWLRWCLFSGWRSVFSAVIDNGAALRDLIGMSIPRQLLWLVRYSIGWCIHPHELYNLALTKAGANPLFYVFDSETAGFHKLCNKRHPNSAKSIKLLRDKYAFASLMETQRINMAPTYTVHDASKTPSKLIDLFPNDAQEVFCKLRSSNGGRAAFWARKNGQTLCGGTLSGERLIDNNRVEDAWQNLCGKGEVLVQAYLKNHHSFANLLDTDAPITLRVMTVKNRHMAVENAQLEVPVTSTSQNGSNGKVRYIFIAIEVTTGRIDLSQTIESHAPKKQKSLHDLLPNIPEKLPYWDEIYKHSKNMHDTSLDLWAIAWDWVITADGPFLLEGNSGFRLGAQQMQYGGFIQVAAQSDT